MHGHAYVVMAGYLTAYIYHPSCSMVNLYAQAMRDHSTQVHLHRTQVCMAMHSRKSLITLKLTLEGTTEFIEHRLDQGLLRFQVCMAMHT